MGKAKEVQLTEYEWWTIRETLRTGDLNIFTNYWMRMTNSGTLWMEGDAIGHYRHLFEFEMLYDAWSKAGKPDQALSVQTADYGYDLRILWDADRPQFLLPHGYLMLEWAVPLIHRDVNIALAITATGTGKTSQIAVAALTYCVLYPGFHFLNVAPTEEQASTMTVELEKWISGTPYSEKFVQLTRSGQLYIAKPSPTAFIRSPLDPKYLSRFICRTIGRDANAILGSSQDWTNIDEVQLVSGIDAALPKLMTRSRATRANGLPRWSKLTMLTNPGPSAELSEIKRRIKALQEDPESKVKAVYLDGIDGRVNPYNTKSQRHFHEALMDQSDIDRWLKGDVNQHDFTRILPERLFEKCRDYQLDEELRKQGKHNPVKREGLGIIRYEIPPDRDRFYMVVGDPGQGNPTKRDLNNIPIVAVLDITNFLVEPSKLVAFAMLDGMGSYDVWIEQFKTWMLAYHATGYYDDTNTQGAFEAAGAFKRGYWNQKTGEVDLYDYETRPLTFAALNKRWARTIFVNLAGDGMFRWPYLESLWYQAAKYIEWGEGIRDIPDDIIAALFIYCLALRTDNGLWEKYAARYYQDYQSKKADEIREREMRQTMTVERSVARANTRAGRGGGRSR